MSLDLGIPDGEYELDVSEVLQNQFQLSHNSRSVRPIQRTNDEILSIRCEYKIGLLFLLFSLNIG